jgi:hypothetical protein
MHVQLDRPVRTNHIHTMNAKSAATVTEPHMATAGSGSGRRRHCWWVWRRANKDDCANLWPHTNPRQLNWRVQPHLQLSWGPRL